MNEINFDLGIPMLNYLERLNTFNSWKHGITSSEKMAEAGFYFCGKRGSDTVQCFLCEKKLDCWQPDDNPWEEHRQHSAPCVYAKFGKVESELTPRQLIDLCEFYTLKSLEKKEAEALPKVDKMVNNAIRKFKKIVPQHTSS